MLQTPYFQIRKQMLDDGIEQFQAALRTEWGKGVVAYSFKTNSLPWLLGHMREMNCWAEVVSSCEYQLALRMGFEKDHIVFNGPVKGKEEFLDAFYHGAIINIDSEREIQWLEELRGAGVKRTVGIRVNFGVEDACPGEIGYEEDGTRFGFSYETGALRSAIERLERIDGLRVAGLHMHSTSITRSVNVYRVLAAQAARVVREFGLEPEYIDIGGGYFGSMPGKPSFAEYVRAIRHELDGVVDPARTMLIVEPGTALIGAVVDFVSSVVDVKDTAKSRIVTMDGSRCNIDPLMIKSRHFMHLEKDGPVFPGKQILCGFTCMDRDRIVTLTDAPELSRGDRVVFEKVGSYTMALNPLFISYFPPVYLDDEAHTCVRPAWTVDDYLTKER